MAQIFDWEEDTAEVETDLSRPGLLALIKEYFATGDYALSVNDYDKKTGDFYNALKEWLVKNEVDINETFIKSTLRLLKIAINQGMDQKNRADVHLIVTQLFNVLTRGEHSQITGKALTSIGNQLQDMCGQDLNERKAVVDALAGVPK